MKIKFNFDPNWMQLSTCNLDATKMQHRYNLDAYLMQIDLRYELDATYMQMQLRCNSD